MAGSGDKPRYSITARRKDSPKGSKDRIKIGAGFAGKYPGSFNLSMRDVASITLTTGDVIAVSDHWFDLTDWDARDGRSAPAPAPAASSGRTANDDDVPFRAAPRTAKDIS